MKLFGTVTLLPVLHGRIIFSRAVRSGCEKESPDMILLSLPDFFEESLSSIIDMLPEIHVTVAQFPTDQHAYYIPADPSDPMIEAIRQAKQLRIPFRCIGGVLDKEPPHIPQFPNECCSEWIGMDALNTLCIHTMAKYTPTNQELNVARQIAHEIIHCKDEVKSLLAVIHFRYYLDVIKFLKREETINFSPPKSPTPIIKKYTLNIDTLYFSLGELPYATALYEQERYDPFALKKSQLESIAYLFRDTRETMYDAKDETLHLSPVRLQNGLTFLRNLTLLEGELIPSLFDIVTAAKGIGGNGYAIRILKRAKFYPYLPISGNYPTLSTSLGKISIPDEDIPRYATNILQDSRFVWRSLSIKPDPSTKKRKEYRYNWNPYGMCSHVPEDRRIESFNSHIRTRTLEYLNEAHVNVEKFQSSIKDGIDIRETLRNWHNGSIYVREIPPARGKIDTVIVIFDDKHDDKYSSRTTWYAEHSEESTLSFYGSDPFSDMIGPGVARCKYGGLSLIFPPIQIPDIFTLNYPSNIKNLAQILTAGSLLFSKEKYVAYVAEHKPSVILQKYASNFNKKLIWIPIARFSGETLRKLRMFHILNGHEVRSWAQRYIGD